MHSIAARRPFSPTSDGAIAAIAIGAALLTGSLLATHPAWAVGVFGGAVFLAALRTGGAAVGIALWLPLRFMDTVPGIVTTCMLLAIAAVVAAPLLTGRTTVGQVLPGQRFLVGAFALFLAWLALSLIWAQDPSVGWTQIELWLIAALVFAVVASAVADARALRLVLLAFVAGALLSVVVGALGGGPKEAAAYLAALRGRFIGTEGNPSDLAELLIPAIVLAVVLAAGSPGRVARGALAASAAILTAGLVATQSRAGLVTVVAVLPAALVIFRQRRRHVVLVAGTLVVVAGLALALSPHALSRATDYSDGGSGRTTQWRVAWRIFEDHPLAGAGIDGFRSVAPYYVRRPGKLTEVGRIVDHPHVVHNTYLGLLADTGIVGLGLFLAVIGSCLLGLARAARVFERRGEAELARLSRGVLLAVFAILVIQLFQNDGTELRMWALLALGPALAAMAGRSAAPPPRA